MIRTAPTICLFALLGACGGGDAAAGFGPPRKVPASERPTVWDAPMRDRLGVPDMGKGSAGGPANAGDGGMQVVATAPAGWEELSANPQRFRNAVWRVTGEPDSDCYLTIGVGGGVAGNLRRWYSDQFGKAEVPAPEALPQIEFANRPGRLAEIDGTFMGDKPDWAALIAFYASGSSVTSLKFTGPKSVVAGNRQQFLALAKSIRIASASPNPQAGPIDPSATMPEGHPPTGDGGEPKSGGGAAVPTPPHGSSQAPFTAQIPDGWLPNVGSSRVLHHTFGQVGEVYISQLGGTLKSSFDIWRGEIGLGPMTAAEFDALPKAMFLGEDALLLDLTGTFRSMTGRQIDSARLLVAARVDGATITFCKLVGSVDDVAAQEAAFRQFCGSVRRKS